MQKLITNRVDAYYWAFALWYWFSHEYGGIYHRRYEPLSRLVGSFELGQLLPSSHPEIMQRLIFITNNNYKLVFRSLLRYNCYNWEMRTCV